MRHLLIPIDFSEIAKNALAYAISMAKEDDKITLIHMIQIPVLATPEPVYVDWKVWIADMTKASKSNLDDLIKDIPNSVRFNTVAEVGGIMEGVIEYAKENAVDLILMGTSGATGMKEFFIGSNTEKVVRFAPCPVLAVPEGCIYKKVSRILVPTDLHDKDIFLLKEINKNWPIQEVFLDFVWVHTPHFIEAEEVVTDKLRRHAEAVGATKFKVHVIRNIYPSEGILQVAKEQGIDMVAMATHGRRGIAHLFAGSTAEEVLNHANVPVWAFNLHDL